MLLGGLRAAEVRSLRLADVDMGLRRVRVTGKGGKERVVPVDTVLSLSWPPTCARNARRRAGRRECSVVWRGPSAGQPLAPRPGWAGGSPHPPAGLGGARVRPRASAAAYLWDRARLGWHRPAVALRELMGHANPETTAALRSAVTRRRWPPSTPGPGQRPGERPGRRHAAPPGGAGPAGRLRRSTPVGRRCRSARTGQAVPPQRRRAAAGRHPQLAAWMRRPTPARLADLKRTGAWTC